MNWGEKIRVSPPKKKNKEKKEFGWHITGRQGIAVFPFLFLSPLFFRRRQWERSFLLKFCVEWPSP